MLPANALALDGTRKITAGGVNLIKKFLIVILTRIDINLQKC